MLIVTLLVLAAANLSGCDLYDHVGADYVELHKVDASNVQGVGSVLAKYDFNEDKVYLGKKPFFTSKSKWKHVQVHELIHWTGHKTRLNRVDTEKQVDWYLEECVAEEAAELLLQDSHNEHRYLKSHPLSRKLTSEEVEYVRVEALKAYQYLKERL